MKSKQCNKAPSEPSPRVSCHQPFDLHNPILADLEARFTLPQSLRFSVAPQSFHLPIRHSRALDLPTSATDLEPLVFPLSRTLTLLRFQVSPSVAALTAVAAREVLVKQGRLPSKVPSGPRPPELRCAKPPGAGMCSHQLSVSSVSSRVLAPMSSISNLSPTFRLLSSVFCPCFFCTLSVLLSRLPYLVK